MTSLSILKCLKLLSDPTRLRILSLLQQGPLSVVELQEILGMGQSRISTQLSILKHESLVSDKRSGKHNVYRSDMPEELCALAARAVAELPEFEQDLSAVKHLLRKRKDQARAYFDQLAGKFGKNYVPGRSWKALAEGLLRGMNPLVIADLGAGEGTLTLLLAQRASQVIAVDLSSKMVEFGAQLVQQHGLANVEFRLGEIEAVPIDDATVDLAVLSQALHHAEEPQRAIREAARILRPGGRVLILDLLRHQFIQAHELYADRWLGFLESELYDMLEQNGFVNIEVSIVDRENEAPHFQTLLACGVKK